MQRFPENIIMKNKDKLISVSDLGPIAAAQNVDTEIGMRSIEIIFDLF